MTNAIADAPPTHGEAVRRASGFVLVAQRLPMICHVSPERQPSVSWRH
jgi:hypothetical protein